MDQISNVQYLKCSINGSVFKVSNQNLHDERILRDDSECTKNETETLVWMLRLHPLGGINGLG